MKEMDQSTILVKPTPSSPVIDTTNSSQSETLQVKSHIIVKQTDWC